ncbi:MAG TPA: hypothetical protein VJ301_08115 [Propionibacteriaceae bacterium]|nr:hypothetical protein [Propionibacteriaceae bacterium]
MLDRLAEGVAELNGYGPLPAELARGDDKDRARLTLEVTGQARTVFLDRLRGGSSVHD